MVQSVYAADDAYEAVWEAADKQDVAAVTQLVQRGLSPDTASPQGLTLLMFAARGGDAPMVDALLTLHADVHLRNALGETPLMLAAVQGHTDIVRSLIKAGSDINGPGWTALHYAAWRGHADVCQLLLDNGADIDARGINGITPVMMAVRSGDFETVRLLVWNVADLNAKAVDGATALGWAEKFGLEQIAAHLRQAGEKE